MALERDLGVRLFERSRRQVSLTPVGTGLLPEAHKLLAQAGHLTALAQSLDQQQKGILMLAHTRSAGVGLAIDVAAAFRARHPRIEVATSIGFTAANLEGVWLNRLDAAFVRAPVTLQDGMSLLTVGYDDVMVALPSGHPLTDRNQLTPAEIANEPLVYFPVEHAPGMWKLMLDAVYGKGEPPIVRSEPEEALMLAAVATGAGISLLTQSSAEILEIAGVAIRPLIPRVPIPLALAWRSDNPNPSLAAFLACARELAVKADEPTAD
jgi:DNA-binding transcriptional LysR family regulator